MILGKVIGTVVASQKDEGLFAMPLLVVQPLDPYQKPKGQPLIATDRIGVGPGEVVFMEVSKEAGLGLPRSLVPTDLSIVARVDTSEIYDRYLKEL